MFPPTAADAGRGDGGTGWEAQALLHPRGRSRGFPPLLSFFWRRWEPTARRAQIAKTHLPNAQKRVECQRVHLFPILSQERQGCPHKVVARTALVPLGLT